MTFITNKKTIKMMQQKKHTNNAYISQTSRSPVRTQINRYYILEMLYLKEAVPSLYRLFSDQQKVP